MRAVVVYESMYGNTHAVAVSIAAGLSTRHDVTLVPVTRATQELVAAADLLVVGGPTHLHRMSTAVSRRWAADAARKQGGVLTMDPDADGPGVRGWLEGAGSLGGQNTLAAAFDTMYDIVAQGDGEIIGWRDGRPIPFTELQTRLGRKHAELFLPVQLPARRNF